MVRAKTVNAWRPLGAAWALLMVMVVGSPIRGWDQDAASEQKRLLDVLVERTGGEPGTYVVTDTGVEPSPTPLPLVAQADVQRGQAAPAIRVTLALGSIVAQPASVDVRVVRIDGLEPVVVGTADGSGGPGIVRMIRELTLEPGEYEVWTAAGHPGRDGRMVAALARTVLKVPDVWRTPLAVTPIVISDAVAAAQGAGAEQPFKFGPTLLGPATSSSFPQHASVNVAFRIYNWTAEADEAPDLAVEYLFYQQLTKRLVFFNKIAPQQLNAETLGPSFDRAAGVVSAGITVPLASFTFGEFELRVRVTDKRAGRTSEQQVRFRVSPS